MLKSLRVDDDPFELGNRNAYMLPGERAMFKPN